MSPMLRKRLRHMYIIFFISKKKIRCYPSFLLFIYVIAKWDVRRHISQKKNKEKNFFFFYYLDDIDYFSAKQF